MAVYIGCIRMMEKKIEATIEGLGFGVYRFQN